MAFNFNWSPLTADAGFYTRAQELLTAALNKSPKPPIIVDDIVVTELNLGSIPPELEILEIGDLAEDRFRGIFKMSYSGDAFLTLKTRVQANPLNTYLLTRPAYTSPKPLAAAAGLTIPLQITLSEIRLSGFVILVFSKQKGITLVFRNDPLESLKVSSTFDSISSVRDYLQKEIEGQLRILFMDELPAIIHRLSLRLWVPEYRGLGEISIDKSLLDGPGLDPLLNPPQDPVDSTGNVLDSSEISSLSLESAVEMHSLFSQKNLLRLAALTNSQRTLSLFTPSIQEVVFRAWTGSAGQGEDHSGMMSPTSPALSRSHSHLMASAHSFQDSSTHGQLPLPSSRFSGYGLSLGAGRHPKVHPSKKRKKRVVDLRRSKMREETESVSDDTCLTGTTSAPSVFSQSVVSEEHNDDPIAPQHSENMTGVTIMQEKYPGQDERRDTPRRPVLQDVRHDPAVPTTSLSNAADGQPTSLLDAELTTHVTASPHLPEKIEVEPSSSSSRPPVSKASLFPDAAHHSSILEQALVLKIAGEMARRMVDEKSAANNGDRLWGRHSREESPPPAYFR